MSKANFREDVCWVVFCKDCRCVAARKGKAQTLCEPCVKKKNLDRATTWYKSNKGKKAAYDKERRESNRQLYRDASNRFSKNNPAKKKADVIARRFKVKQQTPVWANFGYMNLFYKFAKIEAERIGKAVHVDHIIPLRGKLVCGLHCEDNMQLLTATANLKKHNHYEF